MDLIINERIITGIDLVEIKRIEKSMENKLFLKKYFTKDENKLFLRRNSSGVVAGNFAAKEAFSKAVGTGVSNFSLIDIEVLRNPLGAPYFNFYNRAKKIVKENKLFFSLSISNTKEVAIAMVVGYKENEPIKL